MTCTRNYFFTMQPEKRTRRLPSELSDTELRNKICEGERGRKEDCKACVLLHLCLYGKEIVNRNLQIAKSA